MTKTLPVAIIGAGPVGLAAAAHLLDRGETPIVLEAGDRVGHSVRQWQHVRMFSPWQFNTDGAAVRLLEAAGWKHPSSCRNPTGRELVEHYLEPLAALPAIASAIRLNARVTAVGRRGFDKVRTEGRADQPFVIRFETPDGREEEIEARAVIDASGTWNAPNPVGSGGIPAVGERAAADRIHYGIPDVLGAARQRYAGRTVAVVGSGHSAITSLIELAELQASEPATRIIWVLRKETIEAAFGGGRADALPARGELGLQARDLVESGAVEAISPFRITRIERSAGGGLLLVGDSRGGELRVDADEVIAATGFRPDLGFLSEIRLSLDPWLESPAALGPLIDPNLHSCGSVPPHGFRELRQPEEGFFIVGMKSYGRAPTFLAKTGYEQVRSIVAALAGDMDAADRVELVLPETGVCSSAPLPARLQIKARAPSSCRGSAKSEAAA